MDTERFNILRLIEKGRAGGVYEAIDRETNQRVALRRFFSSTGETHPHEWQDVLMPLLEEIAAIKHPAVMEIYGSGIDEDGPFMSMELLQNAVSLDELTSGKNSNEKRHLSDENFYVMANNLLDAFSSIHHQGYCHGAISGSSIMEATLPNSGKIYKCVDFGMSTVLPMINPSLSLIDCSDCAIVAPEIFEGEAPSARSDVYMLGQVFYMSLAGGHPFAGLPKDEAYRRHAAHKMAPLSGYRSSVSKDIVNWIEHLTQASPNDRPASAGEALAIMPGAQFEDPPTRALAVNPEEIGKPIGTNVLVQTFGAAQGIKPATALRRKVNTKKSSAGSIFAAFFILICLGVGFLLYTQWEKAERDKDAALDADKDKDALDAKDKGEVKLTEEQLEKIEMMKQRVEYGKVRELLSTEQIQEGRVLGEPISFKGAAGVWFLDKDGKEKVTGGLQIKQLFQPKGIKLTAFGETGVTLIDTAENEQKEGYGLKFDSESEFPVEMRFAVQGVEAVALKARLFVRVENCEVTRGLVIANKLLGGQSRKKLDKVNGVVAIDLFVVNPREDEKFGLDFKISNVTNKDKPAVFIPLALAIYKTPLPALPEVAPIEEPIEDDVPKAVVVDPEELSESDESKTPTGE